MMIITLSILLFLVFVVLGGFHFYWFFGGKFGFAKVIPSKGEKPNSLSIPKFATLIVAFVLSSFGLLYLLKVDFIRLQLPTWITDYAYWVIPSIFLLRAIGEFNYVGFFKKIKGTEFANADSKMFSPLCLLIAVAGILMQLLS